MTKNTLNTIQYIGSGKVHSKYFTYIVSDKVRVHSKKHTFWVKTYTSERPSSEVWILTDKSYTVQGKILKYNLLCKYIKCWLQCIPKVLTAHLFPWGRGCSLLRDGFSPPALICHPLGGLASGGIMCTVNMVQISSIIIIIIRTWMIIFCYI